MTLREWTPEQQDVVNHVQALRALREMRKAIRANPFPLPLIAPNSSEVGVNVPAPINKPALSGGDVK